MCTPIEKPRISSLPTLHILDPSTTQVSNLLQPKIPPHLPPLSLNPHLPQPHLIKNIHPTRKKRKIRNSPRPRNHNLPNRHPLLIPNMNSIPTTRKNIPVRIRVDSIRDAISAISEQSAVCQGFAICCDVVAVDCSGLGLVVDVCYAACVGDVDVFEIRGEFDSIWGDEVVCYGLHYAGFGGEAVDLAGEDCQQEFGVVLEEIGGILTCGRIVGSSPYPCLSNNNHHHQPKLKQTNF